MFNKKKVKNLKNEILVKVKMIKSLTDENNEIKKELEKYKIKLLEQNKQMYEMEKDSPIQVQVKKNIVKKVNIKKTEIKQITKNVVNSEETILFIDFETANRIRSSICQIGIVAIKDGRIIFEYNELIKPEPNYFEDINIGVHGLRENDVKDAKTFGEAWKDIKHLFNENTLVVAHNAGFDISCLRAANQKYNLNMSNFNYACSLQSIKDITNKTLSSYKLNILAQAVNRDFKHHDAYSDALIIKDILLNYFTDLTDFSSKCKKKRFI